VKLSAFITLIASVVGAMLIAFPSTSANAEQPPQGGFVAVPKIQYDSAKKATPAAHQVYNVCKNKPAFPAALLALCPRHVCWVIV
jgi:hypothetical protein